MDLNQLLVNLSTILLSTLCLTIIIMLFAVLYFVIRQLLKTSMLTVFQGVDKEIKGIPFYVKQGRLTHETTYLETLETYTLTAKKIILDDQGKPAESAIEHLIVKTVSLSPSILEQLASLRLKVRDAQQTQGAAQQKALLDEIQELFEDLPAYRGQIADDSPLESNQIKESNYVDYETIFYLNQHQPLSGTSELDFALAADGTLQKTTAKVDDTSFEKLLGLLPTDTLIAKPAVSAEDEVSVKVEGRADHKYEIDLAVEQRYVRHIYSKVLHARTLLPDLFHQALPLGNTESWYRREFITELNPKPKETPTASEQQPETPKAS